MIKLNAASVVLAAMIAGLVLIGCNLGEDDIGDLDKLGGELQTSASPSISTVYTVVADAVVVPVTSAKLSLPAGGIVEEILVSEGDLIQKGQVLVRLDTTRIKAAVGQAESAVAVAKAKLAQLEAAQQKEEADEEEARPVDVANARLAVRDAVETLNHVSAANQAPGAVLTPEGAIMEAERLAALADARQKLRDAQEALLNTLGTDETDDIPKSAVSVANKTAREEAIAAARVRLLDSQQTLEDANEIDDTIQDAKDQVAAARLTLDSDRRALTVVQLDWDQRTRKAQDAFDEAAEAYREVYRKWLGIELTEKEVEKDPGSLLAAWDSDLEVVFDGSRLTATAQDIPDDPSTRWNELTIYTWLFLHPQRQSLIVTCGDEKIPSGRTCIRREIDDAWDLFTEKRDALETSVVQSATANANAERAIIQAENALETSIGELDDLRSELPVAKIALAEAAVADAQAALTVLEEFPIPADVAVAKARVAAAQTALEYLEFWPDPLKVSIAEAKLAVARVEAAKLEKGRDPLDVAISQAELAIARAQVLAAEAGVASAQAALDDSELLAPFTGTVVAITTEVGEQVSPGAQIVRLADLSTWRIETEDLDELSAVNLREGDSVLVTFGALRGVELTGLVTRISQLGEAKRGNITYVAEIDLQEQDERLRWNMTATINKRGNDIAAGVSRNVD